MRALIAIMSCARDRDLQQAQRDTWLKNLGVDYRFFHGWDRIYTMDEVSLNVDDSYAALSLKTKAICQWAHSEGYDFVFKCDIDTIVNGWNLLSSGYENHDYMGGDNKDVVSFFQPDTIQFASGGAGYWLSRKAMNIVAMSTGPKTCAEDVYVAWVLKQHGILPHWHSGYRWRPGAAFDNEAVTLHLSSALQKRYDSAIMYQMYEKIREEA